MKLVKINNKTIEICLLNRYMNGYTYNDDNYEKIKTTLFQDIKLMGNIQQVLNYLKENIGNYNYLTEELYYEFLIYFIKNKMHKNPSLDYILTIL